MTGSTYLCVAISVERYLGICHRNIKLHRKFRFYLIGIIFLTLAIESPRFFELERTYEDGTYQNRYAKHRWSASYVTYYCMWFRLFATALVPLTALIYFNAKIVIYYRDNNFTKAYSAMKKLNHQDQPLFDQEENVNRISLALPNGIRSNLKSKPLSHKTSRERALFIVLCCITFTFSISHLPRYGL